MALEPSSLGPITELHRMSFHQSADHTQENVIKSMECYKTCQQQILHCLQMGGVHAETKLIRALQDCASITATISKFILRNSQYLPTFSMLAKEICLDCANVCEGLNDTSLKECAAVCRSCAEMLQTLIAPH